jgi:hypothetical protein
MMMIAEMLLPFIVLIPNRTAFFTYIPVPIALAIDILYGAMVISFIGMQLFIHAVGNYGTFNVLTILLTLPWFPYHRICITVNDTQGLSEVTGHESSYGMAISY